MNDQSVDFKSRVLCSDGTCIGAIGLDGRCNECGRPHNNINDDKMIGKNKIDGLRCKTCGFIAFGEDESTAKYNKCLACGNIIGEEPAIEQSASSNEVNLLDCCNREESLRGRKTMEKKTRIILGFSLVVALLMLVFAPEKGGGYEFIADIDEGVDVWRLVIQLAAVGCLSVLAVVISARAARVTAKILAVLVLLMVVAAVSIYLINEYPKRQVSVSVKYDTSGCSEEYPLAVFVSNNGSRRVSKVYFTITAYTPGRSTDLIDMSYGDRLTFDKIVEAKQSAGLCWKIPHEYKNKLTGHSLEKLLYEADEPVIILD